MLVMKPEERWAHLAAAAAVYMNASDEKAFEAGRYVIWPARVFGDYIGSPERGRVLFFSLEGPLGAAQQFRPALTGWAAVSPVEGGFWQFGLGMELERAPGAYPRLQVCWPMRIRPGSRLLVQIGATAIEVGPDKGGDIDFDPICERMFQLGISALGRGAKGQALPPGVVVLVDQ